MKASTLPSGQLAAAPAVRLAEHAVVLRRSVDNLQVGLGPAVVVPLSHRLLLQGLTATTSPAALAATAEVSGLPEGSVGRLLDKLSAAGLLVTGARPVRRSLPVLRLIGSGPVARRTVSILAEVGLAACYLAELPGAVSGCSEPGTGSGPADELASTLRREHPDLEVRRARHWTKPDTSSVDLTVLVADGPEVDRLVTDTLTGTDQPHLVLRSSGSEVSVGPLVVPGRSSCLRCADLTRRDADPQWPWLLAQLTRLHLEPAPSLLAWASAYAATQALAFLSGGEPECLGHTVELGTRDHAVRLRAWPLHRECGCRWGERTE